jgi:hypothetical protein
MISILIPLYNGIEFIDQSVQSVIQQTYTHQTSAFNSKGNNNLVPELLTFHGL